MNFMLFLKTEWSILDTIAGIVKTNGFQILLNYPDVFEFDLIIYDYTAGPCFLPFVHKFKNPPLIAYTGYSLPSFTPLVIGGHWYFSYVPHNALLSDGHMNVWERFHNFLLYSLEYMQVHICNFTKCLYMKLSLRFH